MYAQIKASIENELSIFDQKFKSLVESEFSLIQSISNHVFQTKGKQIRPILVLLSYRLFHEKPNDLAYLSAALVEIMHAASLIHDDVVDNADQRRGLDSTRFIFGNKMAVLAGDYLLSNAILKAHREDDQNLMLLLVDGVKQMSEGELIQLEYTANPHITEDVYYQIIKRKTAALFACCCQCGALAAGADRRQQEMASLMGLHLGIAFQIKDDILDFKKDLESGKQYANDIREKKITLPLLRYLDTATETEVQKIRAYFEQDVLSEENISEIVSRVIASDACDYADKQAKTHTQKALSYLKELAPEKDTEALQGLIHLIA